MRAGGLLAAAAMTAYAGAAWAEPQADGAISFPPAATPIAREIHSFHDFILPIIVAISVLVLVLLLWVVVRYNRKANPTPKKFTHNMTVEVIWTIVPVLILVAIAWRSFPLLYHEERIPPQAELTLKVTGNSWFWSYEYPDLNVSVISNLLPEDEARAAGQPYLLATNNALYVPTNTTVRVLVTSNDVIHSFAVPQFGIKEDAIQGRVNDTWFNVDRPGIYYGQCSELCGKDHAFMPIEIHAVPRAEFNQWVAAQGGTVAGAQPAAPAAPAAAPAEGARAEAPAR
jgi:cytochrome c oxidase subunit 2